MPERAVRRFQNGVTRKPKLKGPVHAARGRGSEILQGAAFSWQARYTRDCQAFLPAGILKARRPAFRCSRRSPGAGYFFSSALRMRHRHFPRDKVRARHATRGAALDGAPWAVTHARHETKSTSLVQLAEIAIATGEKMVSFCTFVIHVRCFTYTTRKC